LETKTFDIATRQSPGFRAEVVSDQPAPSLTFYENDALCWLNCRESGAEMTWNSRRTILVFGLCLISSAAIAQDYPDNEADEEQRRQEEQNREEEEQREEGDRQEEEQEAERKRDEEEEDEEDDEEEERREREQQRHDAAVQCEEDRHNDAEVSGAAATFSPPCP
jgi:hypothetical protein